jgi:hypothetical protein
VTCGDAGWHDRRLVAHTLGFLPVRRLLGLADLGPAPDANDVKIAVLRHQIGGNRRGSGRRRFDDRPDGGEGDAERDSLLLDAPVPGPCGVGQPLV